MKAWEWTENDIIGLSAIAQRTNIQLSPNGSINNDRFAPRLSQACAFRHRQPALKHHWKKPLDILRTRS
jgi:hypothetical protein